MRIAFFLYCISGFISLGYQVAWFRVFIDHFGSTNLTFGLVLTCFISGLGFGSLYSRPLTQQIGNLLRIPTSLRLYGVIELLVTLAALLTLTIPLVPTGPWGTFPYEQSGGIFQPTAFYRIAQITIGVICVFVPCFFMGVTFPLLCDVFREQTRFPSAVYAWNTLGACSAIIVAEFVFLPIMGHRAMFIAMLVANGALALIAMSIRQQPRHVAVEAQATPPARAPKRGALRLAPSVALCCSVLGGFLTGALEADLFKRLGFLGCIWAPSMSFISFWAILAIFLSSSTVRISKRLSLDWIKVAFGIALIYFLTAWHFAYPLRAWANAGAYDLFVQSGRETFYPFQYDLKSQFLFAGIFVFPAFYLLSLLLPYVCNAVQARKRHLGVIYGLNTAAFCVGMIAFTWLAPRVNLFYSLKLFVWIFVIAVALLASLQATRPLRAWRLVATATSVVLACLLTPRGFDRSFFAPDSPPAIYPVRAMRSNAAHTTYVVSRPEAEHLYFDSYSMSAAGGTADEYTRLMAHFPLLAQESPEDALLICFGVGNTASAIASHESIERIDIVDLNDKVFETASEFAKTNLGVADDPRARLIHDDGRNYLQHTDRRYDLITSEPPPPMEQGVFRLYSKEYYESVRDHLTAGGMMTQWLPLLQMPSEAVAMAISTFIGVFSHNLVFAGDAESYILVGGMQPIDLNHIAERFDESARAREDLRRILVTGPVNLLARILKLDDGLRREYANFPTISDLHNDLTYLSLDPRRPAAIRYDPHEILAGIDLEDPELTEALEYTLSDLGRLKSLVLSFPESALMTTRYSENEIALSDVDWDRIGSLMRQVRNALYLERNPAKALGLVEQAMQISDRLPHVLRAYAVLQEGSGDLSGALASWIRFQSLDPENPHGYVAAGVTLMRMQRYDEAAKYLERAAELDDGNAAALQLLAEAYFQQQHWSEALEVLDRVLELIPGNAEAIQRRDAVLEAMGAGS